MTATMPIPASAPVASPCPSGDSGVPSVARRSFLKGTAATASAAVLGASTAAAADADPIYAMIKKHQAAYQAFSEACAATDEYELELQPTGEVTWRDPADPKYGTTEPIYGRSEHNNRVRAETETLQARQNELSERFSEVEDELISTTPSTLAGSMALADYIVAYCDTGGDLAQECFVEILNNVSLAIEAAIEGASA